MSFDSLPPNVRARMMESMQGNLPVSDDIIDAEFTEVK